MYDRSTLIAAATAAGDEDYTDLARRLGVPRTTAWRLWHGTNAPSARLLLAVEEHYGVDGRQLVTPAEAAA